MTSIALYLQPAPAAGSPLGMSDLTSSSPGVVDFASLLRDAQLPTSAGVFEPGGQSVPRAQLQSAIAEAFNAFGFFEPSVGTPQLPSSRQSTAGETSEAESPHAVRNESAAPALTEDTFTEIHGGGVAGGQQPMEAPAAEHGSPTPAGRKPVASENGPNPSHDPGMMPLAEAEVAERTAENDPVDNAADVARDFSQLEMGHGDRIIFQVAEHVVELIARVDHLSSEEEQRLLSELESLLKHHGLSLGLATINGHAVRNPFSGSDA